MALRLMRRMYANINHPIVGRRDDSFGPLNASGREQPLLAVVMVVVVVVMMVVRKR